MKKIKKTIHYIKNYKFKNNIIYIILSMIIILLSFDYTHDIITAFAKSSCICIKNITLLIDKFKINVQEL